MREAVNSALLVDASRVVSANQSLFSGVYTDTYKYVAFRVTTSAAVRLFNELVSEVLGDPSLHFRPRVLEQRLSSPEVLKYFRLRI